MATLVNWFDGYREFSCVDVGKIERVVNDYPSQDIRNLWKEVKKDIYKIGGLPAASSEIVRTYKVVSLSKLLFVLLATFTVLLWVVVTKLYPSILGPGSGFVAIGLLAVAYNANIIVYFLSQRSLYNKVRAYYQKHASELQEQRRRVKEVTQALIDKLARSVRRSGDDPSKFELNLYNSDYRNIIVTGKKGRKYRVIVNS